MKDERIQIVKQWLKPKSIRNIQVFFRFANFYWRFIQGFSYIAAPLTSMLKTIGNTESAANPKETKSKAGGNSIVGDSMVDDNKATN